MKHIAATAEAAKFDMFFLGDGFATGYGEHPSTIGKFEPLTLLSALAMTTSRLGLAATGSTTDAEPYHVARSFASLVPAPRRLQRHAALLPRLVRRFRQAGGADPAGTWPVPRRLCGGDAARPSRPETGLSPSLLTPAA